MQEITSVNNQLVKETVKLQQKKYRDNQKQFLIEGFKPIKEAFDAGIEIKYAFVHKEKKLLLIYNICAKKLHFSQNGAAQLSHFPYIKKCDAYIQES